MLKSKVNCSSVISVPLFVSIFLLALPVIIVMLSLSKHLLPKTILRQAQDDTNKKYFHFYRVYFTSLSASIKTPHPVPILCSVQSTLLFALVFPPPTASPKIFALSHRSGTRCTAYARKTFVM